MGRPRTGAVTAPPGAARPGPDGGEWADGALPLKDAADFLGCGLTTLDEYRSRGLLVEARHGVRVVVSRRSLVRLLGTLER